MKKSVVLLALVWCNAFQIAIAMEPSIVLVTTEETLVYRTNNGAVELKERRANGTLPGDTQQGQTLQKSPDRDHLVAAYLNNFLDCGQDVIASEPMKEWVRLQIEPAAKDEWIRRLVTRGVDDVHVMVAGQEGAGPQLLNRETGKRSPGSPCGVSVKIARVSPGEKRVAFVFEDVKTIEFYGQKGNLSWSSRLSGANFVHLHPLRSTGNPITTSKIVEAPLDLLLTDEGNWWLLVAKHSTEWWKPANWLYALAGHGTRRSDVFLQTYTFAGQLVSSRKVASGVVLVTGRLGGAETSQIR